MKTMIAAWRQTFALLKPAGVSPRWADAALTAGWAACVLLAVAMAGLTTYAGWVQSANDTPTSPIVKLLTEPVEIRRQTWCPPPAPEAPDWPGNPRPAELLTTLREIRLDVLTLPEGEEKTDAINRKLFDLICDIELGRIPLEKPKEAIPR